MPKGVVKASAAVGRLLREKRQSLGLSLREVSERQAEAGELIPPSTLARIEQGKLDPGVRRLHRLLRQFRIPAHAVADLIDLEDLAIEVPTGVDLETLYREGTEAWKRGDMPRGLAYLFAVRRYAPDGTEARLLRQRACVAFAVAARNIGKVRLAREILDDLLCEPPDPSLLLNVLVEAASVWLALGSVEMATALIRQAEVRLDSGNGEARAWVLHQKARVLLLAGKSQEASEALDQALDTYRAAGSTLGEAIALVARVSVLEALGRPDQALSQAREAIRFASEQDRPQLEVMARLKAGRLLVSVGRVEDGLPELHRALGEAVLLGDRHAEFLAHHHLWKTFLKLGEHDHARLEFEAASHFLRYVDEVSPETEEVRNTMKGEHNESVSGESLRPRTR